MMKKNLLFLALTSVMLSFTGCAKDDVATGDENLQHSTAPRTLTAQMGDDATRAMLTPNGKSLLWSAGDKIAMFADATTTADKSESINYTLKSGAGEAQGRFETTEAGNPLAVCNGSEIPSMHVVITPYYKAEGAEKSNMYHDYQSFYSRHRIGIILPQKQVYTEGSCDPRAVGAIAILPTAASSEALPNLKFQYITSIIRLPLSADETKKLVRVELEATGMPIIGSVSTVFNKTNVYEVGKPIIDPTKDAVKEMGNKLYMVKGDYYDLNKVIINGNITLNSTTKNIYFGIIPYKEYQNNKVFTFTFHFNDGTSYEKDCSAPQIVKPGTMVSLPALKIVKPANLPVLTKNATGISWTKKTSGKPYIVYMSYEGENWTSLRPSNNNLTSYTFAADIDRKLNALLNYTVFKPGMKYTFNISLYDQDTRVSSSPVTYDYTFEVPKLTITKTVGPTGAPIFAVQHYDSYAPIQYAYLQKKEAAESDFNGVAFTTLPDSEKGVLNTSTLGIKPGTDYTFMIRGTAGGQVKASRYAVNYTEVKMVIAMNIDTGRLDFKNPNDFPGYSVEDIKIYSKPGSDADMSDLTGATVTQYSFNADIYSYAPENSPKQFTVKAVMIYKGEKVASNTIGVRALG
ncbi:MAG: hypothetical protein RR221_03995 [Alistipes sp.]